jgi:hypothetical protein
MWCGHERSVLHIGKSSGGWRFVFRAHPELGLNSAKEWYAYLEGKRIIDEYGAEVDLNWLKGYIETKMDGRIHHTDNKILDPEGHPIANYEFS